MWRKKYHEEKKEIEEIQEEVKLISRLFTDLNEEVSRCDKEIHLIEDEISKIADDVKCSEEEVKSIDNNIRINTLIGIGLGSLVIIYSPYIGIPSLICGGFLGYYSNNFISRNKDVI